MNCTNPTSSVFQTLLICVLSLSFHNCSSGQTEADFKKGFDIFKQAMIESQSEVLEGLTNPQIVDMIAIAERAERRLLTDADEELRRVARDLDDKITGLLTNDIGKWLATQPKMVALFIKFDSDALFLSDESLNARRERLRTSCDVLRKYRPDTQGTFDPAKHPAAFAIIEDANWIEATYKQLSQRLESLKMYEAEFPKNQDWSLYPTMQTAKTASLARLYEQVAQAEIENKQRAADESAAKLGKSIFDQEMKKTDTLISGRERLAEIDRQFMEAEFGRKSKESELRIVEENLRAKKIESTMVESSAKSEKELLVEYLTSDRVSSLLAPFSTKGVAKESSFSRLLRIDSLTPQPMSLSEITRTGIMGHKGRPMEPTTGGLAMLIKIANARFNDRPGWPIDENSWDKAGDIFTNMKGELVNPYVEAQRIMREHGPTLVELGILNK